MFELQKLATLLDTKGNKILQNVKMCIKFSCCLHVSGLWLNTLPSLWNVGRSFWKWNFARSNVQKLLDVKLIFGHCILPFLELVHMLFKYAKGLRDVYIYDFVEAIKMFMFKFYEVYNDHECKFRDQNFNAFHISFWLENMIGCL